MSSKTPVCMLLHLLWAHLKIIVVLSPLSVANLVGESMCSTYSSLGRTDETGERKFHGHFSAQQQILPSPPQEEGGIEGENEGKGFSVAGNGEFSPPPPTNTTNWSLPSFLSGWLSLCFFLFARKIFIFRELSVGAVISRSNKQGYGEGKSRFFWFFSKNKRKWGPFPWCSCLCWCRVAQDGPRQSHPWQGTKQTSNTVIT